MKKKMRILALALVMAVALIGAGYAAWGTSIVDNTILQSADWNVILDDDAGDSTFAEDVVYNFNDQYQELAPPLSYESGINYDAAKVYDIASGNKGVIRGQNSKDWVYMVRPTINQTKDIVNFAFYNLHPGTAANTRFEIRNAGTIPAKIANITVTPSGSGTNGNYQGNEADLAGALLISGAFYRHTGSTTATLIGQFEDVTLAGLQAKLNELLQDIVLKPSEVINTIYDSDELEAYGVDFAIPAAALDGNKGTNAKIAVEIKFDFVQYNQVGGTPN